MNTNTYPTTTHNLFNLKNLDCLELLRSLPDESVDLIIADPPYFEIIGEKWDHQWSNETHYLEWCAEWTKGCERVLKQGAPLYVWGTTKTDTFLRYKLDVLNQTKLTYQQWIIWSYNWGGRTKTKFPRKHEDLLGYSKGKIMNWHGEAVEIPRKMKKNIRTGEDYTNGTIPTSVWEQNNHTTSKEYCGWHPTQKPVVLLERLIRAHTVEGNTVLDPFSGSGSTAIATLRQGRKFIGSELDSEYYEKSLVRINELI